MKISKLQAKLEELKQEHGDLECYREYDSIADDIYKIEVGEMPDSFNNPKKIYGVIIY